MAALGDRLARVLADAWATVRTSDEVAVARWLAVVVPAVLAAQTRAVALSDAYLAAYLIAEGNPVRPAGLAARSIVGAHLRGVPIEAVYSRPIEAAKRAVAEGAAIGAALAAGRARVMAAAATDVQLAARAARAEWAANVPIVKGWRRSLGGGQHCALCVSAAGTIYEADSLMPIHDHCTCVAEPVLLHERRQRPITHSPINDSPGLRDAALAGKPVARVEHHGELGPVLVAVGLRG